MPSLRKAGFLILFILLLHNPLFGQTDSTSWWYKPGKNVIHADLGFVGYSASYERTIFTFNKSQLNLRAGGGFLLYFDGFYYNLIGSVQYLVGSKYLHFEAGLGLNYMLEEGSDGQLIDRSADPVLVPLVMVGLRFDLPGKGPVLRMGMGTESSLFSAGIGFKF